MGYRQPVRVSLAHYGLLWLGYHLGHLRSRTRPAEETVRGAALRICGAATATASFVLAGVDRVRPRPLGDGALLLLAALTGIGALAVAGPLGIALAHWMMTSPDAAPPMGAVVVVGVALLGLLYLVFASKGGRRVSRENADG
ncbi:hypothetical protein HDA32_001916 [Spinactinospora alkalitolerans]|uniref:Uncharacterized protein n=1 Tax=Spinactinospora alkalitolerans TaxID=687207 RepID=A0A852TQX4_9ACTN|nr:hypothetical protein [Spinactinospora alkalitolerans]NYE46796.1 hypothetical protein [Spinactinospora alkalitolerans]